MISEENAKILDNKYSRTTTSDDDDAHETDPAAAAPYSILPSDEEREAIINDALDELADIARENILEFKREDFNSDEIVGTWIDSYLCQYFSELNPSVSNFSTFTAAEANALNEVTDAYILDVYNELVERFYEEIAPPRVSLATHNIPEPRRNASEIATQIRILQEKPQPDQRTPEWYARRNNLITASAASKAFGSQASINQLIYEKCKSNELVSGAHSTPLQGSVNSPLHWGQRYEPLTVMIYEHRNHTKLGEFGCIQHDTHPFIGASPDGINIDTASPIYGRMVEIKNIFNRDITGHPKEEYWIQMQIQMEVCDLDDCDFVETRFREYDCKEDYDADSTTTQGYTANESEKGIILWFQTAPALTQQGFVVPPIQLYEYAPIGATPYEYDKWEVEMFTKHERLGSIWVRTIYWYLDEYSCVLVRRNRLWFAEAVVVLQQLWTTIEEERQSGFEHRAPKRKQAAVAAGAAGAAAGVLANTGAAISSETEPVFKIVKLDTAIITDEPASSTATNEVTATNMAILMSLHTNNTNKKYSGNVKRPSDVLINCFKIDDLDLDESKME
jgi:putative phage-type endonuclease